MVPAKPPPPPVFDPTVNAPGPSTTAWLEGALAASEPLTNIRIVEPSKVITMWVLTPAASGGPETLW